MVTKKILNGSIISLRQIEISDCNNTYVEWLNNPQINQFLETRWKEQTMESILRFVREQRENDHSFLFAIKTKSDGKHIGNIKIGPINCYHRHADISYFIGDINFWSRGIATEAIHLICQFAFEELGLHRIEAGTYAEATGSWKALEKNGFIREGVFRKKVISGEKYMDIYRYSLLRSEYKENTARSEM